ncbi:tellurium resistance protein [Clostridia bacterium]|nr:tellurium resistance protein [Clostridia bacterium]
MPENIQENGNELVFDFTTEATTVDVPGVQGATTEKSQEKSQSGDSPVLIIDPSEAEAKPAQPDGKLSFISAVLTAPKPDESKLTTEEKAMIADFADKIDVSNGAQIMQFGASAQKKIAGFSEQALANVKAKDMDAIGNTLTTLVSQLRNFEAEQGAPKKPGFFKKTQNNILDRKAKYDTVEKNIDNICNMLESHKVVLLKDVAMLDQMYEKNQTYYKELTMYILAGRKKLEDVITVDLPELQRKAIETNAPEDAQAANQLADMCNRFDKKLHDLELTRMVSIQMSPQIRLVQSSDSVMVEKIQTSLVNTIPLWKNQMVLALGITHSQSAIKAQREVTDFTNQLLKQNADTLKISTIEAAKESERGIVDIETLRHTNQSLITTLDEVMKIQSDGRQKRREAEKELVVIENELKQKLLSMQPINPTE